MDSVLGTASGGLDGHGGGEMGDVARFRLHFTGRVNRPVDPVNILVLTLDGIRLCLPNFIPNPSANPVCFTFKINPESYCGFFFFFPHTSLNDPLNT